MMKVAKIMLFTAFLIASLFGIANALETQPSNVSLAYEIIDFFFALAALIGVATIHLEQILDKK